MTKATNSKLNSSQISRTQNPPTNVSEAIEKVAANDENLKSLYLSNQKLRPDLLAALFGALRENNHLVTLSLQGNNIGDSEVAALSEAIKDNYTLSVLDLSKNNISENGVKEIIGILRSNDGLVEVNLAGNNLGDDRDKILGELKGKIGNNHWLHEIENKDDLKDHLKSLKNKPSIVNLEIPGTEVGSPKIGKRQKDCCIIL